MSKLASSFYPESRDRIQSLISNAMKEPNLAQTCVSLSKARNELARVLGPRVFDSKNPDPVEYPQDIFKCSDPRLTFKKLQDFLKSSGKLLYPKARNQVIQIMRDASKMKPKQSIEACKLLDENRHYLIDLFSQQAGKVL
jgi:hypothetical protein